MVPRVREICRDTRVVVVGLDDGLVPESDNFELGRPADSTLHPVWYAEQQMIRPLETLIKDMACLPDMVISDHLTWAGATAAKTHGINHACHATWPLHMLEECGFLPPRSFSSRVGITVRRMRSCRLAPAFLKPAGPPRALLDGVRRQCLGGGDGEGAGEGGGGLVLVTSSFGIEPPRSMSPLVKVIGRGDRPETADTLEEHPELKAFLDAHGVVVYVTFGSRVPPPPALVRTVGEGLVAGGWAVVWSLKRAEASHLPRAALASGRFFVRPWLPQGAALAHPNMRAAVTHCGMGGLFECAVNAVPLVPLPFTLSADQPINARAAESAGFAARPHASSSGAAFFKFWQKDGGPQYTAGAIRDAVLRAVQDPELSHGARRAQRAVRAAGYGRTAVDAVESACLYGSDHLVERKGGKAKSSKGPALWAVAGGVMAGVLVSGAAGFLAAVMLAHAGGRGSACGVGGKCRAR
ncbi:unnamed protein product [Laminaria digitata]